MNVKFPRVKKFKKENSQFKWDNKIEYSMRNVTYSYLSSLNINEFSVYILIDRALSRGIHLTTKQLVEKTGLSADGIDRMIKRFKDNRLLGFTNEVRRNTAGKKFYVRRFKRNPVLNYKFVHNAIRNWKLVVSSRLDDLSKEERKKAGRHKVKNIADLTMFFDVESGTILKTKGLVNVNNKIFIEDEIDPQTYKVIGNKLTVAPASRKKEEEPRHHCPHGIHWEMHQCWHAECHVPKRIKNHLAWRERQKNRTSFFGLKGEVGYQKQRSNEPDHRDMYKTKKITAEFLRKREASYHSH